MTTRGGVRGRDARGGDDDATRASASGAGRGWADDGDPRRTRSRGELRGNFEGTSKHPRVSFSPGRSHVRRVVEFLQFVEVASAGASGPSNALVLRTRAPRRRSPVAMSASPSRKRPRRSAESAPIAPPPGMGFDPAPSAPHHPASLVPPPPPSTTTVTTVPPPPPVGAPPLPRDRRGPPPPPPASSMSADAAKAAAQRAASRVHASLDDLRGSSIAAADLAARYPGRPPGGARG